MTDKPIHSVADFLSHYGVKGMKWGVVNEDEPVGNGKNKKPIELDEDEKAILKVVDPSGTKSESLKAKYGPGSSSKKEPRLTPEQKHALKVAGGAALAVGGLYLLNKHANRAVQAKLLGYSDAPGSFKTFVEEMNNTKAKGLTKKAIESLSSESIELPAGSIFKRVSMDRETTVRPGGFYAAYKDADVERYKAVLPVFWKVWGYPADKGYLVDIKSKVAVKAPSPKRTFEMFSEMLGEGDDVARTKFKDAVMNWIDGDDPLTKQFFDKLKSEGYNAVVDLNDAGSIGESPLRLLDGTQFVVDKAKTLTKNEISAARKNLLPLGHSNGAIMTPDEIGAYLEHQGATDDEIDEFLEHFGVKGMKWGVRRQTRLDQKAARLTQKAARLVEKADKAEAKSSKIQTNRDSGVYDRRANIALAGLALVGVGAVAAKAIASRSGDVPISKIDNSMTLSGKNFFMKGSPETLDYMTKLMSDLGR